ncbi:MAG: restriction endonuclease subunit S [Clostridia bacterium]|nr:restriction endonuclease subunit S [Clostridia bacterium]
MNFKKYKISEISKSMFYGSMPKDDDIVEDGKYPIFSGYRFVGYSNKKNIDEPTLIVVARGVGGTGDVKIAPANSFLTNLSIAIDIDETVADKKFLYYFLNVQGLRYLDTGAAQSQITINNLKRHSMLLPDLSIQKRIADILSTYDDLIENNNRRIALLEKAAQELYKEWFVRFRFPGYENAKFENGLPEGWERRKISAYYDTCSGGTPSRTHEEYFVAGIYPWVKTGEIKDCIIIDTEEYITKEAVKKSSAKLLPVKSVAMAMYGVNIGQLGYFDKQMTCNQACCVFSDKRSFSSKHYLFQYLKSIREYLLLISFGAAQQNLSQELIKKIKIVMPSDDVVRAFEEKVDAIYDSIKTLMYKSQNLAKQRDLLLPRLMSGKLEV